MTREPGRSKTHNAFKNAASERRALADRPLSHHLIIPDIPLQKTPLPKTSPGKSSRQKPKRQLFNRHGIRILPADLREQKGRKSTDFDGVFLDTWK